MNKFKVLTFGCSKPNCCDSPRPAIIDLSTSIIIAQCVDEKTAEIVCKALNFAQNEGVFYAEEEA
jgi:hypothetical protein